MSSVVRNRKKGDNTNAPKKEAVAAVEKKEVPPAAQNKEVSAREAKKRTWITRTWTTLLMVGAFFGIVYLGHFACVALVVALMTAVFKELEHVFLIAKPELSASHSIRGVSWSLYFVTVYLVLGRIFLATFPEQLFALGEPVRVLARYHYLICFCAYSLIFVAFVLTLEAGKYKKQIKQYAWTHLLVVYVVVQTSFWVSNIFRGLYWFLFPASLVIVNDVFAFVFGSLLGRTPLIKLSPKKTWEGFIGGAFSTFLWAVGFGALLMRFPWLTCPKTDLYSWEVAPCAADPAFVPRTFAAFGHELVAPPVLVYSIPLAAFASFIAPFGGFFASGIKRAFSIKDFANIIPGHGGITDRMDCQFIMGMFTYLFINAFVLKPSTSPYVASFLEMDKATQLEVFNKIKDLVQ